MCGERGPGCDDGAMSEDDDVVLAALDELVAAGRENIITWIGLMTRVDAIRDLRRRDVPYRDMAIENGMPIIDAISTNQERLTTAAAHFRRVVARELQTEGLSPAAIARAFGVSRQRVASLLAEPGDDEPREPQHTLSPEA